MRTRQFWGVTAASLALTLGSVGAGWSVERQLVGIVLGRSFKTVLSKYGNPDLMVPIYVPVGSLLQATGGGTGLDAGGLGFPGGAPGGYPGAPGMGGPGAGYGGPGGAGYGGPPGMSGGPGYPGAGGAGGYGGPPGMSGGPGYPGAPGGGGVGGYGGPPGVGVGSPYAPPGMSGGPGGGPPVLPPGGGEGGAPGGYPGAPGGGYGGGDQSGGGVLVQGNAVKWVYLRPGGMSYEFWINEDGRVAQIAVTGRSGNAVTSKGVRLGSSYSDVLNRYGPAEVNRYSTVAPDVAMVMGLNAKQQKGKSLGKKQQSGFGQLFGAAFQGANVVTDVIYTRGHHAAFTLVDGRVARITIALAD